MILPGIPTLGTRETIELLRDALAMHLDEEPGSPGSVGELVVVHAISAAPHS
jgi:hypothetical protein